MSSAIEKSPRVFSPSYIEWIRSLNCIVCDAPNPHPHHIIGHGYGGEAIKADDYLTMPLCFNHHTGDQGVHRGHQSWERKWGCQLRMCVQTLIVSYGLEKISQEICMEYLLKLEPKVGMEVIGQELRNYLSSVNYVFGGKFACI